MKTLLILSLALCSPAAAQPPRAAPPNGPAAASADEDGLGPALVDLRASTPPFTLSPGADERYDIGIALMYRLEFAKAEAFVTPRRLTLVVDGLPLSQPDVREERRGPRADAPEKALQGFLGSVGLTLEQ